MSKISKPFTNPSAVQPKALLVNEKLIQKVMETVQSQALYTANSNYNILIKGTDKKDRIITATLIADKLNRELYKVELTQVVSKYIGETEKNLARLFEKAENKKWILFFDEADALFGKRTTVKDSHDRYANVEISYLLQRIETYKGICIIAINNEFKKQKASLPIHSTIKLPIE